MPRVEQLYADHEALIHSRVWSWVRTTGREFDDLMGVCHDAFMECVVYWRREKGSKFSSTLATICNHRIQNHLKKNDMPGCVQAIPERQTHRTWSEIATQDLVSSLSDEARDVIHLLLNCPDELSEFLGGRSHKPRNIKGALNRLCRAKGMSPVTMAKAYNEIRIALRET